MTRNLTEGRIDGRTREGICHGRTRNLTEKAEAETRKKTEAAEAETRIHGISRKKIVSAAEAFATD